MRYKLPLFVVGLCWNSLAFSQHPTIDIVPRLVGQGKSFQLLSSAEAALLFGNENLKQADPSQMAKKACEFEHLNYVSFEEKKQPWSTEEEAEVLRTGQYTATILEETPNSPPVIAGRPFLLAYHYKVYVKNRPFDYSRDCAFPKLAKMYCSLGGAYGAGSLVAFAAKGGCSLMSSIFGCFAGATCAGGALTSAGYTAGNRWIERKYYGKVQMSDLQLLSPQDREDVLKLQPGQGWFRLEDGSQYEAFFIGDGHPVSKPIYAEKILCTEKDSNENDEKTPSVVENPTPPPAAAGTSSGSEIQLEPIALDHHPPAQYGP